MKKSFLTTATLIATILIFSNFSDRGSSTFIFTALDDSPELPDFPHNYKDIEIPPHLIGSPEEDTIFSGYDSFGVDTTIFDFIQDDIATLGRVLFYDEKLSALENISCASCHDQALSFTENKSFSEGINAETTRNSMHLNDIGWSNREGFFWDMRETDLFEMISLPLTDANEIGANMSDIEDKLSDTEYYPELFEKAFGDRRINEERIVDALVQFISSFTTFNSRFDQEAERNFEGFTASESNGQDLFSTNCGFCHTQGKSIVEAFFPDGEEISIIDFFPFLLSNGLPIDEDDKGVGEWNSGFDNLFKLPSLRNIELTAPYMHDGRFATLDEVINHYSEEAVENEWSAGFIPDGGFGFSENEKADLKAFLLTLTDDTFATQEKWSDPFKTRTLVEENEIQELVIRPNPLVEQSLIDFSNPEEKLTSLNLYSSDGKLIEHQNTTGEQFEIRKSNYLPGVYFIQIIMDDKKTNRKLIVK